MDVPSDHVLATLLPRAGGMGSSDENGGRPPIYKIIGIILAVCSGLFIGVSFVMKKVGLLKANVKYNEEAGEGYGYLKNFWWWAGMTLMILGEICNFVAYAFTDAILVTPLGALSVVVTTILSAIFLKERLSFVGKVGCFICIIGSVVIALNAPEQAAVSNIQDMQHYVIAPGFLTFAGVIIVGSVIVAVWVAPKYGKKSMLVYISICSLVGGLSVVATQGLGSAILAQANGESQFDKWFLYVLLVFVIGTLLTEIVYLNKALNIFNAALVTPTYYVYFTSSTIVSSAILFQGFNGTAVQIVDVVMGFLVICSGVVLLQLSKSSKDVPDAAVFKGDLDQVRTVAEQEEPEYEPRADTIRGGAGVVRAMSRVRTQRQANEAKRIHEERMQPVGEHDEFEWDGLRRRKTVSSAGGFSAGSVKRTKTVHPPLGMTRFPSDSDSNASDEEADVHPGFFGRIARSRKEKKSHRHKNSRDGRSPVPLENIVPADKTSHPSSPDRENNLGMPRGLQDQSTEYRPDQHIHFAGASPPPSRGSDALPPPRPPTHNSIASSNAPIAKRQFSFQNVFNRKRSESAATSTLTAPDDPAAQRPRSRGALSFTGAGNASGSRKEYPGTGADGATEEERLGLVVRDSYASAGGRTTIEEEEEEWTRVEGRGSDESERDLGGRRGRDQGYEDGGLYDGPLESEGRGGRGGAFV